jgi:hypothetical protein
MPYSNLETGPYRSCSILSCFGVAPCGWTISGISATPWLKRPVQGLKGNTFCRAFGQNVFLWWGGVFNLRVPELSNSWVRSGVSGVELYCEFGVWGEMVWILWRNSLDWQHVELGFHEVDSLNLDAISISEWITFKDIIYLHSWLALCESEQPPLV